MTAAIKCITDSWRSIDWSAAAIIPFKNIRNYKGSDNW